MTVSVFVKGEYGVHSKVYENVEQLKTIKKSEIRNEVDDNSYKDLSEDLLRLYFANGGTATFSDNKDFSMSIVEDSTTQ